MTLGRGRPGARVAACSEASLDTRGCRVKAERSFVLKRTPRNRPKSCRG